jgi:uncharacterized protein
LTEKFAGGLKVFVCEGECGGLWFGHYEIAKLKGHFNGEGADLLRIRRSDGVRFFRDVQAVCPQCTTSLLFRHFFSKEMGVEVCQCPKCGGFWLDLGGLMDLESRFGTEGECRQAAASYFETIFGGKVAKMNLLIEDVLNSARAIAKMFLFVCPKKYLPEKRLLPNEYFSDLNNSFL